jgi:predicted nucleic acid-binding protein
MNRIFSTFVHPSKLNKDTSWSRCGVAFDAAGTICPDFFARMQVLNEIASVFLRKMSLSGAETRNFLVMIRGLLKIEPITIEILDAGINLAERYQLSGMTR